MVDREGRGSGYAGAPGRGQTAGTLSATIATAIGCLLQLRLPDYFRLEHLPLIPESPRIYRFARRERDQLPCSKTGPP